MRKKKALRTSIKAALARLSPEQKRQDSARVATKVLDELKILDKLSPASGICIYLACDTLNEVDAERILQRAFEKNLRVYLPRVLDRDSNMHFLRVHAHDTYDVVPPFGIREPTLLDGESGGPREDVLDTLEGGDAAVDVIFMPGLGFGENGARLGRGGGYYDAFIGKYMAGVEKVGTGKMPMLVGLAFDEQIVGEGEVPMDAHDHYCHVVVSPTRVFGSI
jgi:5-formyltetrahydrofolate cyclo-ligase